MVDVGDARRHGSIDSSTRRNGVVVVDGIQVQGEELSVMSLALDFTLVSDVMDDVLYYRLSGIAGIPFFLIV